MHVRATRIRALTPNSARGGFPALHLDVFVRAHALALVAPQRSAALPDVPTVAEAGLREFEVTTWYGVLAPAGTPRSIVMRLNGELVKIMHSPELKEKLAATGTDPLTSTPEEFAAYIKSEIAKWGDVIRKAGVKAD